MIGDSHRSPDYETEATLQENLRSYWAADFRGAEGGASIPETAGSELGRATPL